MRSQRRTLFGALVDGYKQFRDFNRAELALMEPLRTLRLIHYSAWLARRWNDPTFPVNFPWFGSRDYWQGQVQMLEEPLVVELRRRGRVWLNRARLPGSCDHRLK